MKFCSVGEILIAGFAASENLPSARFKAVTLRPRLHESGQIVARTTICTVPPCVYTGPAELDEFLNG